MPEHLRSAKYPGLPRERISTKLRVWRRRDRSIHLSPSPHQASVGDRYSWHRRYRSHRHRVEKSSAADFQHTQSAVAQMGSIQNNLLYHIERNGFAFLDIAAGDQSRPAQTNQSPTPSESIQVSAEQINVHLARNRVRRLWSLKTRHRKSVAFFLICDTTRTKTLLLKTVCIDTSHIQNQELINFPPRSKP